MRKKMRLKTALLLIAFFCIVVLLNGGFKQILSLITGHELVNRLLQLAMALFVLNLVLDAILEIIHNIIHTIVNGVVTFAVYTAVLVLIIGGSVCWLTNTTPMEAYHTVREFVQSNLHY